MVKQNIAGKEIQMMSQTEFSTVGTEGNVPGVLNDLLQKEVVALRISGQKREVETEKKQTGNLFNTCHDIVVKILNMIDHQSSFSCTTIPDIFTHRLTAQLSLVWQIRDSIIIPRASC